MNYITTTESSSFLFSGSITTQHTHTNKHTQMKPLIQKSTIAFMLIWIFTGNEFAFTADSDSLISSKTNEIKVNADTSSMMSVATTKNRAQNTMHLSNGIILPMQMSFNLPVMRKQFLKKWYESLPFVVMLSLDTMPFWIKILN